jgi:hypothetical protein
MRTRAALGIVFALVATTALAACDDGGGGATTAAAPAAAPPPPPAAPPPPPPPPAERVGLSVPYATEAEWIAGCTTLTTPALSPKICECAAAATVKEVGTKGLYMWVWEAYIQRAGMGGKVRSDKWFEEQGLDKAAQQKFADAIGKCYVTQ